MRSGILRTSNQLLECRTALRELVIPTVKQLTAPEYFIKRS
jgi:hypothetical protein